MAYGLIVNGEAVEVAPGFGFTDADGIMHPANWLDCWSAEDIAEKGLLEIVEPEPVANHFRRISTALQVEDGQIVRVATDEAVPLSELKAVKLQAVRDRRWIAENAGVTVNGASIRTDERTQAKVSGALQLMALNPSIESLDWEAQPGVFVALDQAQLEAVGLAIGAHVQNCFSRSRELCEAVMAAANAAALAAIDIDADWPG